MKSNNYIKLWFAVATYLLLSLNIANASTNSKRFIVGLNILNYDGTKLGIKPGDTVYIEPGHRDHLRFYNIHGDSLNCVVFINNGGLVELSTTIYNFGIQVYNCSYFKLTGTGSSTINYGIKIGSTPTGASGLSLDGMSTNYEIDHLEVTKSGFAGICANPKPDCDNKLNRGNFTRMNTIFHDNYVHNTYGEAFYIGHSFYTGYTITCDSTKKVVYPHEIHGLKIYNNVVDSSGWDGIQVGCATINCEIYGNHISNYGVRNTQDQNFGIIIGGGTGGKCYNNFIVNGTGNGMCVFGIGGNLIYNNIIVNPGHPMNDTMTTTKANGIFCDDRCTTDGASFSFFNNTIISPCGDGIRFFSTKSKNSKICNNIILKPGSYGSYYNVNQSYVYYNSKTVDLSLSNNYYSNDALPNMDLTNLDNINLYCSGLPIIDQGMDVRLFDIFTDFNGNERLKNNACDIGAFEYSQPAIQKSSSIKIIPENSAGEITIYSTKKENLDNISVYQLSGQLIYNKKLTNQNSTTINLRNMVNKGIYLVSAKTESDRNMNRIYIND
jgi:hypothetical protein